MKDELGYSPFAHTSLLYV